MLIAVWIAVALVCFVLPSVTLTNGGKNVPDKEALAQYAKGTGLPLTDEVAGPVVDRIRRRERGMLIGGIATIVLSGLASIVFDGSERWGALVFVLVNAGMVFGAAWIMATYQPTPLPTVPWWRGPARRNWPTISLPESDSGSGSLRWCCLSVA
ncbi:MAG: hypothetical protein R2722_16780 [Tessaracoccus sp.]